MALVLDLGKCSASRGVSLLGMVTKHSNSGSETKHTDIPQQSHIPTFISITGACALMIKHSVFFLMAGLIVEMLFMLFSVL